MESSIEEYRCIKCSKKFMWQSDLNTHICTEPNQEPDMVK